MISYSGRFSLLILFFLSMTYTFAAAGDKRACLLESGYFDSNSSKDTKPSAPPMQSHQSSAPPLQPFGFSQPVDNPLGNRIINEDAGFSSPYYAQKQDSGAKPQVTTRYFSSFFRLGSATDSAVIANEMAPVVTAQIYDPVVVDASALPRGPSNIEIQCDRLSAAASNSAANLLGCMTAILSCSTYIFTCQCLLDACDNTRTSCNRWANSCASRTNHIKTYLYWGAIITGVVAVVFSPLIIGISLYEDAVTHGARTEYYKCKDSEGDTVDCSRCVDASPHYCNQYAWGEGLMAAGSFWILLLIAGAGKANERH